jgi:hypothetical protein
VKDGASEIDAPGIVQKKRNKRKGLNIKDEESVVDYNEDAKTAKHAPAQILLKFDIGAEELP